MTTITVNDQVLESFNEERRRINAIKGTKMTGEEFVQFLLGLSRKVKQ